MTTLSFVKYHGLGNDFILVDNRHSPEPIVTPEQAEKLCDRHFGIGADGVILALPGQNGTDYTMRIYNSDGSEPEMCGNGIRCMARFLGDLEGAEAKSSYTVHTLAGLITPKLESNGQITVDMGRPRLAPAQIHTTLVGGGDTVVAQTLDVDGQGWSVTCVSMGNPHCMTFVEDVATIDLEKIGPLFEHHVAFPQRTNTEFVEVVSRNYLKMRVWERGAGITLACGTGACATLVAAVLNDKADRICTIELPGGPLKIEWASDDRIFMTGPAERVFAGQVEI